ncbi:hypothetical protein PF005_g15091 [Phytophthora fragariae]|uniref:Uncharacterized protein n=2 Tax=Phytophthora TaxID=4783 RepID=A0A6A3XEE0_9STRA|nr:hypothetical protein PF003_g1855 [Phytophthora fragariae]KAE8978107.1 hypothetical protein PR001_g24933 [Phytophthora rubi]KAE8925335.1 hypothetical protein PF009_g24459 [Phytophthora fragariae]KAE8991546.1 hypothetical protein PF011_g17904 [Phytophthora fragariae]KAE9070196.1 hypothetical protein PF007_g27031 [Phytophthora fragariae]
MSVLTAASISAVSFSSYHPPCGLAFTSVTPYGTMMASPFGFAYPCSRSQCPTSPPAISCDRSNMPALCSPCSRHTCLLRLESMA